MTTELVDLLLDIRNVLTGSQDHDIDSASEWNDGVNYGLGVAIKVLDHKLSTLVGSGT
jgi:hypothetical protein